MKRAFRSALICGALPLVGGVGIFVLLLTTQWDWLIGPGLYVIYVGTAVALFGVLALVRFCWMAVRTSSLSRARQWAAVAACGVLLLSNFPLAAGVTIANVTSYTVVVHNGSEAALTNVRVIGGGCNEGFGSIPPGSDVRRTFWIQRDGMLKLHADRGTTTHVETIDTYVTNSMGGRLIVNVESNGTVSVRHGDT